MEESQAYKTLERIGNGAFGEVYRAKHIHTGAIYAIKRLRVNDDGRLRVIPAAQFHEIESLRQLIHPNIVRLVDVFPDGAYLSLVMEYMETDLFSIIRNQEDSFDDATIRGLMRMMLHGVAYCHSKSILHRDIKPGNMLVSYDGIIKLSDFGLATVYIGTSKSYSHQVATRWYRAPELLFGGRQYDFTVDMWSLGAIFAELLLLVPLFPGQNDIDQLFRIIQVLGSPEPQWPDVVNLPDYDKVSFPAYEPIPLKEIFPDASPAAVDLVGKLLALNPAKRISAQQALSHPYFFSGSIRSRLSIATTQNSKNRNMNCDGKERRDDSLSERDAFLASLGKPLFETKQQ